MSGITGVFYRDGRGIDAFDFQHMVNVIAHRGPDAEDVWIDGSVGLGHRMLWTTPESLGEKLPLAIENGDLVITSDARIDNRDELWSLLGNKGRIGRDVGDSELILAAYRKWGKACPEHLLGDFAFAIWDARKHLLFCARDHFGVRPFYYYQSDRLFTFSSEVKSLLCLEEVPDRFNESKIADYLTSTFDDVEETIYQDIRRLPPAHSLTVKQERIHLNRYWSLDPYKEVRLSSDGEYAERFRELFQDAVACRLRSAYPVGSLLSGGLDSSAVTCMARSIMAEQGGNRLATYSAVFDKVKESDEQSYISAVLSQNGFQSNFVHGDEISPLVDHDRVLWHQDEPLYAFNYSLNWSIYNMANDQGVRIMLDGFDGDTTVSHGTGYMVELARSWRWLKLYAEVKGFSRNFNYKPWPMMRELIWRHNISPFVPDAIRRTGRGIVRGVLGNSRRVAQSGDAFPLLNRELAERLSLKERRKAMQKPVPLTEREAHHQALNWAVMPYTLEVLSNGASAHSIEPRYPFFDKRLVEYCLALPGDQKIHNGWTRMVMRRALDGILPNDVQWRRGKASLGPNFEYVFMNFEKENIENVVLGNSSDISGYVDMSFIRDAYTRVQSQTSSHDDIINIWKALTLALWLRKTGVVTHRASL